MDCCRAVDDYCDAWQRDNLEIPENAPSTGNNLDYFFISVEIEVSHPLMDDTNCDDDGEEQREGGEFVEVEGTDVHTFWEPCPRIEHGNLPNDAISRMLTKAGVPLHKQEFMVDKISSRADQIASEESNKDRKVIPMFVSIGLVACSCYGESVED